MDSPRYNGPLARWLRASLRPTPDPWPAEIAADANRAEAQPLCLNCVTPHARHQRFCPTCGYPVDNLLALNPYLQIFVIGEVARRGVQGAPEKRVGVWLFLIVFSGMQYGVFAPVYWYWLLRRAAGRPIALEQRNWPRVMADDTERVP